MKTANINCYKGLYGLSCIENTILMNLKEQGDDITWLYADSEISLKNLIQCFFYGNQKYIFFNGFPQIHSKLEKRGIISINAENKNAEQYLKDIETNKEAIYMIKLRPECFKTICKFASWRDDYFLHTKLSEDGSISLKYDVPFFETNMEKSEVKDIYSGQFLKIMKLREIDKEDERLFRRQHQRVEIPKDWKELCIPGIEYMSDIFTKLRDLIWVYIISRRRRQAYESSFRDTSYMEKSLCEIDTLFTFVGQMSLKINEAPSNVVFQILRELWETELKIN